MQKGIGNDNINDFIVMIDTFPLKPIIVLCGVVFAPLFFIAAFYLLVISPSICSYYIVPGIEKKMGKKLGYSPVLGNSLYRRYMHRQFEISRYILNRYRAWKKNGDRGLPTDYNLFALKNIGYTIENISRGEIIFSYLVRISLKLGLVSFIIGVIASYVVQNNIT